MHDIIEYASFLDFWASARPETPFGRDVHERPRFFRDIGSLEEIYDRTDALLPLFEETPDAPARPALISHHLKRLPRLPIQPRQSQQSGQCFDEMELFQVKKFLHNYARLMAQLPHDVRQLFGFEYRSQKLEALLNRGGQGAEIFYIADDYSLELAEARAEILRLDAAMQALETERAAEIKERFGIDFAGRPFLLVPKDILSDYAKASKLMAVEPYDDAAFSVRPLKSSSVLALAEKRQAEAQAERLCEAAVLETLSAEVLAESGNLQVYLDAALAFDLAWARARMARELGLARPRLRRDGPIRIAGGRFPPCESVCRDHAVPYTPLDAEFGPGATVLFGSNMGGKTVALQTVALLQLAAQAGLFVPAINFETRVFHAFHYIGERRGTASPQGLSGFAVEMRCLMDAWADIGSSVGAGMGGALLLMDEFARTTCSTEAEALLAAVLEAVAKRGDVTALCSTHFHGLPRLPDVRFLRMAGLVNCDGPAQTKGDDPIKEIARRMSYRLVQDDGRRGSDAIAVARLLGLDGDLIKRAENFYFG